VQTIKCRYIKPPNNSTMHGEAYEAAGCFTGRYLMSIVLTYHERVICSFCFNFASIYLHFIRFVPFGLRDRNFVSIAALCGKCSGFLISFHLMAVTIRGEEHNPLYPCLYSPLNPLVKTKFVLLTHNKINKTQKSLNTSTFGIELPHVSASTAIVSETTHILTERT